MSYEFEKGDQSQKCLYVINQIKAIAPKVAKTLEDKLPEVDEEESGKYYQFCVQVYRDIKTGAISKQGTGLSFKSIPSLNKEAQKTEPTQKQQVERPKGVSWLKFIRQRAASGMASGTDGKKAGKSSATPSKKKEEPVKKVAKKTSKKVAKKAKKSSESSAEAAKKKKTKSNKKTSKKTTKKGNKKASKKVSKKTTKKKSTKKKTKKR